MKVQRKDGWSKGKKRWGKQRLEERFAGVKERKGGENEGWRKGGLEKRKEEIGKRKVGGEESWNKGKKRWGK